MSESERGVNTHREGAVFVICVSILLIEMIYACSDNSTVVAELNLTPDHENAVPGEVIVGFRSGLTPHEQESIIKKHGGIFIEREPALDTVLVKVNNLQAYISEITREAAVEYAEPNYIRKLLFTPNDPFWSRQYNLKLINADDAWEYERGKKSIKIAIVDSGIQYDHPDLKANYVRGGYDWVNDDPFPYDDYGHGTHCAGIAAAVTNNRKGIAGIAQVSLMAEKVANAKGYATVWDTSRGIIHAVDEGASIISFSLGKYSPSSTVEKACQYAWDSGCLLVAAAGNDGEDSIACPARYDSVIAVGAIDRHRQRWYKSNHGPELELVAPGVEILSTYTYETGGGYATGSGTSAACPHVAGVAALMWSRCPSLTNRRIRDLLMESAIDLGTPGWDEYYGWGMVNAEVVYNMLCDVIYVPDNYTTIQAAVDAAGPGNIIIVRDGSYTENIDVHTPGLTIRSESGPGNCILHAARPDDHLFEVTAWGVNISGFTVEGATGSHKAGIYLDGVAYCNISGNIIRHNYYGIALNDSFSNIIYNNYFSNTHNAYDNGDNLWNTTRTRLRPPEMNIVGGSFIGGNYWSDYTGEDVDGDGIGDTATPYNIGGGANRDYLPLTVPVLDTGHGTYPSIMGTYEGKLIPSLNLSINRLYTYPCPGTGGHTEFIRIYEGDRLIASGTWNGYRGDWHNITITPTVRLLRGHEYRYIIKTGSYTQVIHRGTSALAGRSGWINCTLFTDANGEVYHDWIPAIKLFLQFLCASPTSSPMFL